MGIHGLGRVPDRRRRVLLGRQEDEQRSEPTDGLLAEAMLLSQLPQSSLPPAHTGIMRAMTITGLDHVHIAAPPGCEAAARHFYGDLLGLPELEKPSALHARGGVWFACGAQALHLGVANGFSPARKAHPALRTTTDGLDTLADRLAAADHPVEWSDELPGIRRFYTADPFGNRVELLVAVP